ncbi:helix-turn-helix transcriptional regulator [uncultured Pseudonocardia sp.]|jgi:ArsR family transcriptional regulator|uniref:ArsR/SmtB family transcription factor n=1 Tax=uncultured Pseudonocardia sp. TaxID=211455 RepID=UPI0026282DB6|nr:metalloregulator ArsR/SmtB family transcription factor [uncultured Pseudonocardia sp.]
MSNQGQLIGELGGGQLLAGAPADQLECCSPLTREPLTPGQALGLAAVFKALGDPVRLRLASLIASHAGGEACVCDLTDAFDLSGPTISHHLKVLREAGLITGQRRGTWVYYRIQPDALRRLSAVLVLDDRPPGDTALGATVSTTAVTA